MDPSSSKPGRRRRPGQRPPRWLTVALCACVGLVAVALFTRSWKPIGSVGPAAAAVDSAKPTDLPKETTVLSGPKPSAVPAPEFVPAVIPSAVPSAVPTAAAPPAERAEPTREQGDTTQSEPPAEDASWFSDAVFIGDSRVAGLRLYSGVTPEATFLDHTGLTIYEVKDGKAVIRRGDRKISVLDALDSGTYGKVYIALGVNELGYYDPEGFAQTCGEVVEAIRERQSEARIYIQSIIPVNTEKCKANDIPYYITNEGVASYNQALASYFEGKDVYLMGVPGELLDETGEALKEYSADGVHFKKDGYVLWLSYLAAHTEG